MAQPVWVLSVDLQTKTATFQSGMSDAAKAARGSFQDIKDGADDMGRSTSGSMMEARHGVMLLGEEFGIHLPRALTTFIASIGPVGAALSAAFPFLAILVGATLLLEHLAKLKQAGETLTESQTNFGTVAANVLNSWNDKLLQAGIKTDELNGNHLGALNKTLELIDHQSMKELVQSFDTVAKAADVTFAQLKTSWYQWGAGSAGAKNSLEQFKVAYDALLAKQDAKGGTSLLDAKIEREQRILALQQEASRTTATGPRGAGEADMMAFTEARIALQKLGVGYSENEIKAQLMQVSALKDLVDLEAKRAALVNADQGHERQTEQNRGNAEGDKAAREQAASQRHEMEDAQKLWEENYRTAVSALQESEREKIDATEKGSAARLAVIDAALKEEQSKGLQDSGFYKSLLTDRVNTARQMSDEEKKIQAEAAKETEAHVSKMGELQLAADREAGKMRIAQHAMTAQEILQMEMGFDAKEHATQQAALNAEIAALDTHDRAYENKKKELHDKLLELDKQFQNKEQVLADQANMKSVSTLTSWLQKQQDIYTQEFSKVLMGKESFGKMMQNADSQIASQAITSALQSLVALETVQGRAKFADARKAAADAWASAGNPFLGAVEAAGTFAAVMALESGGIVPGVGIGDIVPAMLTPGEAVLPKGLTEQLTNAAKFGSGDSGGGADVHVHYSPTQHFHSIDGDSVRGMLDKHADTFTQHIHNTLRKMNK